MIKNLFYTFKAAPALVRKSLLLELLQGILIAIPTGFLLLIVRELFSTTPDVHKLWMYALIMAILLVCQLFVAGSNAVVSNRMTYTLSTWLRINLGKHLQTLSMGTYKQRDPGDIVAVALQDVANFEIIFGHTIAALLSAVFTTVLLSAFLLFVDWKLALILLAALPVGYLLISFSNFLIVKEGQKHVAARNATGARFLEYVQGIRHIKSYGLTGEKFSTLEQALNDFRKASIRTEAIPGPFILTVAIILELFFLAMVYVGVLRFTGGLLAGSTLITFLILGYRLYEPIKAVMIDYLLLRYMNISLTRVLELLALPAQSAKDNQVPAAYNIQFEDVSFSYIEEKPVLKNVSFQLPQKSMLALVGPSGSGKTTITALIARFWDAQQGTVRIGNIDVKDMQPGTVNGLISEVFQEVHLFDDSIYNNIRFGRMHASHEAIMAAAEKARVLDYSFDLPNGLDTKIGEGGNRLSGGQKQRISIARALLKDAPIILVDEATASLDPENEIYIQQAIQELVKAKTVVVIAHKLATIQKAGHILVLDKGEVVEQGNHASLMNKEGLYRRLWDIQTAASGWKA